MIKRFYKDGSGAWFIDLKFFPFNKAWLMMVAGADKLLDTLSKGEDEVKLKLSLYPFPETDGWLEKKYSEGLAHGAIYDAHGTIVDYNLTIGGESELWLCPATLWVFGKYPKKIYYKVVE